MHRDKTIALEIGHLLTIKPEEEVEVEQTKVELELEEKGHKPPLFFWNVKQPLQIDNSRYGVRGGPKN